MARLVLAATVNYIMTKSLCGGPSTRDLPEVARGPDDPGLPPAVHRYHVADGPLRPRVSDHPPDPLDHGGVHHSSGQTGHPAQVIAPGHI